MIAGVFLFQFETIYCEFQFEYTENSFKLPLLMSTFVSFFANFFIMYICCNNILKNYSLKKIFIAFNAVTALTDFT